MIKRGAPVSLLLFGRILLIQPFPIRTSDRLALIRIYAAGACTILFIMGIC